ncbi:hypothetical protein HK100_000442 [Physocladia obscura]|uniref:Uncharacterized protein n=1 Tax=Physocladia obscura TaxID=109957 RepID=A0AAD5T8S8_9FUNG|nr:hypothetical protein HK100_000442 [Physocladia obscura]
MNALTIKRTSTSTTHSHYKRASSSIPAFHETQWFPPILGAIISQGTTIFYESAACTIAAELSRNIFALQLQQSHHQQQAVAAAAANLSRKRPHATTTRRVKIVDCSINAVGVDMQGRWKSLSDALRTRHAISVSAVVSSSQQQQQQQQQAFVFSGNSDDGRSYDGIVFWDGQIDPVNLHQDLRGSEYTRVFFDSLHCLEKSDVRRVLHDCVLNRAPIIVFEKTERTIAKIVLSIVLTPIIGMLFLFFHGKQRLGLVQLWLFSLCWPFFVWDEVIGGCLRTYSEDELWEIVYGIPNSRVTHEWCFERRAIFGILGWVFLTRPFARWIDAALSFTIFVGTPKPKSQGDVLSDFIQKKLKSCTITTALIAAMVFWGSKGP